MRTRRPYRRPRGLRRNPTTADAVASGQDAGEDGVDVAGWDDLVSYVRVRYEVMRQADGELWFNLPTNGGRTQLVVVRRVTGSDGEPWAQIASPVCKVGDADLDELLALAGESVVGGMVAVDGVTMFRHSIPLDDAAIAGFERPFRLVVETADRLEELVTGADVH
jgi:hypothetical protein